MTMAGGAESWQCAIAGIVRGPAVGRGFGSLTHAVVANNAGDAEVVVGKDMIAVDALRLPVHLERAPLLDCGFIAPEGERQHLARLRETFKALDRDEAVD